MTWDLPQRRTVCNDDCLQYQLDLGDQVGACECCRVVVYPLLHCLLLHIDPNRLNRVNHCEFNSIVHKQESPKEVHGTLSYTETNADPTYNYSVRLRTRKTIDCQESSHWSVWSDPISECCLIPSFKRRFGGVCIIFLCVSVGRGGTVGLQTQHAGDLLDFARNTHDPPGRAAAATPSEVFVAVTEMSTEQGELERNEK